MQYDKSPKGSEMIDDCVTPVFKKDSSCLSRKSAFDIPVFIRLDQLPLADGGKDGTISTMKQISELKRFFTMVFHVTFYERCVQ